MRTELDLNESEIDLNECEHFLKANIWSIWVRSELDRTCAKDNDDHKNFENETEAKIKGPLFQERRRYKGSIFYIMKMD